MSIVLQHRTIAEATKPIPPVPTGVWKLQAIELTAKQVTKTTRDGTEFDTIEYTLSVAPIEPTASVDPEELKVVNERTGKPAYDGKRIFLKFVDAFFGDMKNMGEALGAFGIEDPTHANLGLLIANATLKGRTAYGDVFNRTWRAKDGSDGVEQKVRSWSEKGGGAAFAL